MILDLFNLVFNNDIQTWFYIIGISYIVGKVFLKIWNKFLMHKKDKKC